MNLLDYPTTDFKNDFKEVPLCPYCQLNKYIEKRKDGKYLCKKCIEVFKYDVDRKTKRKN